MILLWILGIGLFVELVFRPRIYHVGTVTVMYFTWIKKRKEIIIFRFN
jgi:hypothetical protein